MKKFEIMYYHHTGCCYNHFYLMAIDEDDARRIFGLMFPVSWIEEVYEYSEPYRFFTEEDILKMKGGN